MQGTRRADGDVSFAASPELRAQIYAWAYRLLRNHHDALDATQEVVLRTLRAPTQELRHPTAWLRRVTVNHCLDVLRVRRDATPCIGRIRPIAPIAPAEHGPDRDAAAMELRDAVVRGLEDLSAQQRAVLIAKVYDQETFAEIAESMDLAVPTVKTHYVRALRAMRRSLQSHAEVP